MTIGSFAIVTVIGGRDDTPLDRRLPRPRDPPAVIAALFAFFLLAQAGIPPTGGFIAKLGVFAAVAPGRGPAGLPTRCSIVGVITSVITAFFYLRVILTMYASEDEQAEPDEVEVEPPADGVDCRPRPCSRSARWRRSGSGSCRR